VANVLVGGLGFPAELTQRRRMFGINLVTDGAIPSPYRSPEKKRILPVLPENVRDFPTVAVPNKY
jgi:hypothetical protein